MCKTFQPEEYCGRWGYAQTVKVPEDGIPVFEPAFGTKIADIKINAKVLEVTQLVHKKCKQCKSTMYMKNAIRK